MASIALVCLGVSLVGYSSTRSGDGTAVVYDAGKAILGVVFILFAQILYVDFHHMNLTLSHVRYFDCEQFGSSICNRREDHDSIQC